MHAAIYASSKFISGASLRQSRDQLETTFLQTSQEERNEHLPFAIVCMEGINLSKQL